MRKEQVAHIDELVRAASGFATQRDRIIRDSWRRCVSEHRLDPVVLRDPRILPQTRVREHRDAMDAFLHTARFGVEMLYREVAGLGYVLLLTDAKGVTVDFIGDPAIDMPLMRAGLYLGADWNEPHAGTCAVGTCIATGEALTVHQTDHFDATHIPLTCTAAPIFDPEGQLAAVLDISALRSPEPKDSQFLALRLVSSFADRIEIANLMNRYRREWILRLSAAPEFADVDPSFVLAVDGSGRILGFNSRAARLLAPAGPDAPAMTRARSLVGRRLADVLDIGIDDLPRFTRGRPATERTVRLKPSGTPLFAQSLAPPARAATPARGTPDGPALPKPLAGLFCDDPAMHTVATRAARLVDTRMSLLLQGETGTGKEQLAKAIHAASARSGRPFIAINCAALPESLIEGELFGYEAGTFTGASSRGRKGLVLEADGGTLFLDEIGDMPLSLQTRLLRVLSEREVTPLGRTRPVPVDIRVIAATHHDLIAAVKAGRFREDLYFRLNAAVLTLPALRDRTDFAWLARRILATRTAPARFEVSPEALAALAAHSWPGNIRELVNALDFAAAVASDGLIRADDLPDAVRAGTPPPLPVARQPARRAPEADRPDGRSALLDLLARHRWNVSAVARALGLDRTTVHRRMRRLGIIAERHGREEDG